MRYQATHELVDGLPAWVVRDARTGRRVWSEVYETEALARRRAARLSELWEEAVR